MKKETDSQLTAGQGLPAPICSACGGLSMIEGNEPNDDVMNTPCLKCNPRDSSAVLLAVHQICEDKWQSMVAVDHQTIGFGPLCETEEESQWWCSQFKAALSRAGARFISPNAEVSHGDRERKPDTYSIHNQL